MKLVVMASRVPFPLEKGDKLRAYHQLKDLSEKFEILLICLTDSPIHKDAHHELSKFCSQVKIYPLPKWKIYLRLFFQGLFTRRPFQVTYFHDKAIERKVKKDIREFAPDHIYCQLIRCSEYVKDILDIPKTLDYMDAFSKGMERRSEVERLPIRQVAKEENKRLVAYENLIFDYFDHHTIISEQDRKHIMHPRQSEITIVPNGVDTEFFKPLGSEKKYDLVFVGNMSYAPNVDAALFLVKEILPELQKKLPHIKILISGAAPSTEVKALHNGSSVVVSGWMEDIREAYDSAHIFIAPLQIGTGMQNKILEALSMGIPCLTSDLAGKPFKETLGGILITCKTVDEYIEQILLLLNSKEHCKTLSDKGRWAVETHYSWATMNAKLAALLNP